MLRSNIDYTFKIKLVGPKNAGKTSLTQRFIDDIFSHNSNKTISKDFESRDIKKNSDAASVMIRMNIYDVPRQKTHATIIVFDVTDLESFESAKKKCEEIKSKHPHSFITFVGTKKDDEENSKVLDDQIIEFGKQLEVNVNIPSVSSLSGEGVDELFSDIAIQLANKARREHKQIKTTKPSLTQKQTNEPPIQPLTAKQQNELKQFTRQWSNEKTTQDNLLALLSDYTKDYSRIKRILTFHWQRNHIEEVNTIYNDIKLSNISIEEALAKLRSIKCKSDGTVASMVYFLGTQLGSSSEASRKKIK